MTHFLDEGRIHLQVMLHTQGAADPHTGILHVLAAFVYQVRFECADTFFQLLRRQLVETPDSIVFQTIVKDLRHGLFYGFLDPEFEALLLEDLFFFLCGTAHNHRQNLVSKGAKSVDGFALVRGITDLAGDVVGGVG